MIDKSWDPKDIAIREKGDDGRYKYVGCYFYRVSRFWLFMRKAAFYLLIISIGFLLIQASATFSVNVTKATRETNELVWSIIGIPTFIALGWSVFALIYTASFSRISSKHYLKFNPYGEAFHDGSGMQFVAADIASFEAHPIRTVTGDHFKIEDTKVYSVSVFLSDGREFQLFEDASNGNARVVVTLLTNAWQATLGETALMPLLGETPRQRTATY